MGGSNPSTVWSQLSSPYLARGGIPFVYIDDLTIYDDVQNLWWDQINKLLSVKVGGDQAGTDAVNTYYQQDSYLSVAAQLAAGPVQNANIAGHTVSSSNGTGALPLSNVSGDLIGTFGAWSYQSVYSAITYKNIAGIFFKAAGAVVGNLGGELHLYTSPDGLVPTVANSDRVTLDNLGNFMPSVAGVQGTGVQVAATAGLGKSNQGWRAFYSDYGDSSGIPGAAVINKPAGLFSISIGASSAVITNSLVTAKSIVICVLQSTDATLTFIRAVIPAAGSFTCNGNAVATAATKVAFFVVGVD